MGVLRAPDAPAARARLQRDLVARLPNVSAVDVREVVKTVAGDLSQRHARHPRRRRLALFSGLLILVGAVAMTRFQRLTRRPSSRRWAPAADDHGDGGHRVPGLGAVGGLVGALGALGLSWALSRYLLDMPWQLAPGTIAAGVVLTAAWSAWWASSRAWTWCGGKPLAVLRAE